MSADRVHGDFGHVIIACNGIVCSSMSRSDRRMGTLTLKQYAQLEKAFIEWESFDGEAIWKTDIDDLKHVVVKRRHYLQLMYKFVQWNMEYYFPRANARSFVRMMEVTHCVKHKWSPIPCVLYFTIVEKQKPIRQFSDLGVEHILGARRMIRKGKMDTRERITGGTSHSVINLKSAHRGPELDDGFFVKGFRCVQLIFTKIINSPLVWPILESMGRAAFNTVVQLVKTYVIRSRFVEKIRTNGSGKIFGVAINLQLSFWSSLLTGAFRAVKYFCDESCAGMIQAIGGRYLTQ